MLIDVLVFGSIGAFVVVAVIGHVVLLQLLVGSDRARFS
jgi:hypothetical protein